MRISTTQLYTQANRNMMEGQSKLAEIQNKIASGKNFTSLADDPVGANQVVNLKRELAQFDVFQNNIDATRRRLDLGDTTLTDINIALDRARELSIQAANNTLTDSDRLIISYEFEQLVGYMANLMNSRDAKGEYLFSGSKGTTQTYQLIDGRYEYQGDTNQREIQVASSAFINGTDTGSYLFEALKGDPSLEITGDLAAAVTDYEITDVAAFEKFAKTVGDLRLSVDKVPGPIVRYSLLDSAGVPVVDANGNPINAVDYTAQSIADENVTVEMNGATLTLNLPVDGGITADPGIRVISDQRELIDSVNLVDTEVFSQELGDIRDLRLSVSYDSANALTPYSVGIYSASAPTVLIATYDYSLAAIEAGSVNLDLRDGTNNNIYASLDLDLTSALDLTDEQPLIEHELAYTPPSEARIVYQRQDTNILNAMLDTFDALQTPVQGDPEALKAYNSQMARMLDQLTEAQDRISESQANLGARMNSLDNAEYSNTDFKLLTESTLSSIQDLDYASASTELAKRQLALEASFASFAKIQGLSLFDYI
ncbi:MAG: flagellar hook-associated protein FlgL [Oceanospirillaceae bacterium]|nr:flagellar hook-associated protein FlgL [Oceanospirillaceae bacterium]